MACLSTVCKQPMHKFLIPYSAKFSRDKIFADRPFANFRGNKFRGSKIPADHAHLRTLRVPIYQEIIFCSSARLQQRHVQLLVSCFLLWCKLGVGSSRFPSLEFDHVLHLTVGSRNGSRRNFLRKRTSWIWKFRITRLELTVESKLKLLIY